MIIFDSAELKMMNHRVMKHFINLNQGKNDQWNTHLSMMRCCCFYPYNCLKIWGLITYVVGTRLWNLSRYSRYQVQLPKHIKRRDIAVRRLIRGWHTLCSDLHSYSRGASLQSATSVDEGNSKLRMSEATIATRSRDSSQPIRMHVSFELRTLMHS